MSRHLSGIIGGFVVLVVVGVSSVCHAVPAFNEITPQAPRVVPERAAPVPPAAFPSSDTMPETKPAPPDTPEQKEKSIPGRSEDPPSEPENKSAEIPEILNDVTQLPEPVQRMRQRILDAALSGDAEKLRPALAVNETPPVFSFSEQGDPIAALKKESYDGEGREILAIIAEVLEARFVHVDKGTPQEMYVWPYFAQYPIDKLDAAQTVELFRIMTAFEFSEMKEFGAYNFYRIGISPDGAWHFLVSGD